MLTIPLGQGFVALTVQPAVCVESIELHWFPPY